MPIETHVQGEPASLRAGAEWLRGMARAVEAAATEARGVVTRSESEWTGAAADDFRARMGRTVPTVDELSDTFAGSAEAMDAHADDLDTVRSRMGQALEVARAANLAVVGTAILEPVAPPPGPLKAPEDRCPTAEESASIRAFATYEAQCKAYVECACTVAEARALESDANATLLQVLRDKVTDWTTLADVAVGAYAAVLAKKLFTMRQSVIRLTGRADWHRTHAAGVLADPHAAPFLRTNAALAKVDADLAQATAERDFAGKWGGDGARRTSVLLKLARNGRFAAAETFGYLENRLPFLRGAPPIVKALPIAGLVVSTGLTAYEIWQDPSAENVTKVVLSNGAGLAAGAAVALVIAPGAPVIVPIAIGAVAAFGASTAVEWATPHLLDAGGYLLDKGGDVLDAGWEAAKDFGGGLKDFGGKVTSLLD
ncbi:putative T7SS-secreted protein [Actinosynnema sp. NPDC049800]